MLFSVACSACAYDFRHQQLRVRPLFHDPPVEAQRARVRQPHAVEVRQRHLCIVLADQVAARPRRQLLRQLAQLRVWSPPSTRVWVRRRGRLGLLGALQRQPGFFGRRAADAGLGLCGIGRFGVFALGLSGVESIVFFGIGDKEDLFALDSQPDDVLSLAFAEVIAVGPGSSRKFTELKLPERLPSALLNELTLAPIKKISGPR